MSPTPWPASAGFAELFLGVVGVAQLVDKLRSQSFAGMVSCLSARSLLTLGKHRVSSM